MIPDHHKAFLTQLAKMTARQLVDNYEKAKASKLDSRTGRDSNVAEPSSDSVKSIEPDLILH